MEMSKSAKPGGWDELLQGAYSSMNFPELKEVGEADQKFIAGSFSRIALSFGIKIESCAEKLDLSLYGIESENVFLKNL